MKKCMVLLVLLGLCGNAFAQAPESPVARLQREGIRAMCNGEPEKLAAAGFNLTLPWERPLVDGQKTTSPDSSILVTPEDFSEKSIGRLRSWALRCKKNDIIMMYMMKVGSAGAIRYLAGLDTRGSGAPKKIWPAHQYRHVVDWNGDAAKWAPCPLERRVWMGFIKPQLELVARVLNETGASGGGALELETYLFPSIYPGYSSQRKTFCYCDHCFYGFVRSLGGTQPPDTVLPSLRFDWLTQRGLRPAHEKYLEDRMAEIIGEMMGEVRKVKPDFLFGIYPYGPNWYKDALIRGSGSPELPCLLLNSEEYTSGYTEDPPFTFSGTASTRASVAHLRHRGLPAMYAGGLFDKRIGPEAFALAMDPLLRRANGFWAYSELGKGFEPFWKYFPPINRWNNENPGPLPKGDLQVDLMPSAVQWVRENRPEGVRVSEGRITTRYDGEPPEVRLAAAGFEDAEEVARGWQGGRGELPPLDASVFHTGRASIRFEPSAERPSPTSPYITQMVADLPREGQSYELSFWVKTGEGSEPVRFWVGRAHSRQSYMRYSNYVLPPGCDWMRVRTHGSHSRYAGPPPLKLRFWCPPTEGKLWLDDVSLRPVRARTIDVALNPPAQATGWGSVDWKLSPIDARCNARIVDAQDGHDLRITLYPGDSLGPLEAIVGLKPTVLRLEVYPSAGQPVILEQVRAGFTSSAGQ